MPLPDDPDETWALVTSDVEAAFARSFEGELISPPPFQQQERIASDTTIAVPWQWIGRHTEPFLDIPATGIEVDILGVSLLREDADGEVVVHRIVDWLTLYQRLGVVIGNRTTLDRRRVLAESRRQPPPAPS